MPQDAGPFTWFKYVILPVGVAGVSGVGVFFTTVGELKEGLVRIDARAEQQEKRLAIIEKTVQEGASADAVGQLHESILQLNERLKLLDRPPRKGGLLMPVPPEWTPDHG